MGKDEWKFSELSHKKGFQIFINHWLDVGKQLLDHNHWNTLFMEL